MRALDAQADEESPRLAKNALLEVLSGWLVKPTLGLDTNNFKAKSRDNVAKDHENILRFD